MKWLTLFGSAICAIVFGAAVPQAQTADAPVLTIDGKINGAAARNFTISELEALGTETFETHTPWHDSKVTFEGVPLRLLMEHVGASGHVAAILALNNYRTEVPLSDFTSYPVILATKKDGKYMPVSDKGPLFIVYPYDSFKELKNELYYSRSAWQVRKISIE